MTSTRRPTSFRPADELLEDLDDIKRTIRHWRNRGVRLAEVATELRCGWNWSAVERRMIEWMLAYDTEALQEAAD